MTIATEDEWTQDFFEPAFMSMPAEGDSHPIFAFVAYEGNVRRAAATSILIVDDASTPALIRAERERAGAATATELDRLLARFARNATR